MEINENGDAVLSGVGYSGGIVDSGVLDADGNMLQMIIDLDSMHIKDKIPMLDHHKKKSSDNAIGLIEDITIENHQLRINNATLFTSHGGAAERITRQMEKDFPYDMSISYNKGKAYQSEQGDVINGFDLDDGVIVIKGSDLEEVSLAIIGHDRNTEAKLH